MRATYLVTDFSLYPHIAEGAREHWGFSFLRALIPFTRASPSWFNYLPKAPFPDTITLDVRIPTFEFWWGGAQTFSPKKVICTNTVYSEYLFKYTYKVCMYICHEHTIYYFLRTVGIYFHFCKLGMKCSSLNVLIKIIQIAFC